jgi:hypothetical protein
MASGECYHRTFGNGVSCLCMDELNISLSPKVRGYLHKAIKGNHFFP